jgi:hypothetical protein
MRLPAFVLLVVATVMSGIIAYLAWAAALTNAEKSSHVYAPMRPSSDMKVQYFDRRGHSVDFVVREPNLNRSEPIGALDGSIAALQEHPRDD